jgi:sugar lactone lactonase YvrE
LLGTLVIGVAMGMLHDTRALANESQASPAQSTAYLTRWQPSPDGGIVKLLDLQLGLFQPVVTGLERPAFVLCGPDGHLYVTGPFLRDPDVSGSILRFSQDGSGRILIAQQIAPTTITFDSNGNLYFGTIDQGLWLIRDVLKADKVFNAPQQMLPQSKFRTIVQPYAFIHVGPFQGDLLIVDSPHAPEAGGHVLRAIHPDFAFIEELIPPHIDAETGNPFQPFSLAVDSQGDILVTDFHNNKILHYGSDGNFKGIFAKVMTPHEIAVGPGNLVYVTGWRGREDSDNASLFVFDKSGKLLTVANSPNAIGVTVCAPT